MHHVDPRMGQGQRQGHLLADGHAKGLGRVRIQPDGDINLRPVLSRGLALIFYLKAQAGLFADNRKGWGVCDRKPAVPIALAACQQHLQRCGQHGGGGQIMHLPVGDQNNPRDTRLGFLRQSIGHRRHGQGAGIVWPVTQMHNPHLGVGQKRDFGLHRLYRLGGLKGAVGQGLADAVIDH